MDDFREKYKFDPDSIRMLLKTFLSDRVTKVVVLPSKSERINYREEGVTGFVTVPEAQVSAYTMIADELNRKYNATNDNKLEEYDSDIRKIFGEKINIERFEPRPRRNISSKPKKGKERYKVNKKALLILLSYMLGIGVGTTAVAVTVNTSNDIKRAKEFMAEIGTDDPRYAINMLISEMEHASEEKLENDLGAKDVDIIIGEGHSKDGDPVMSKIMAKYKFSEKTYREFMVVAPKLEEFLKYARTHGNGHLSVAHLLKLRQELLQEEPYKEQKVGGILTSEEDGIGLGERDD